MGFEKRMNEEEEERIKKDLELFEKNLERIQDEKDEEKEIEEILDLATRYYEDTKYYLGKRDFFTAFGCINYAHGLLDAIKEKKKKFEFKEFLVS